MSDLIKTTNTLVNEGANSEVFLVIKESLDGIRYDQRDNPYVLETLKVLPVQGYRSAIGSFWNAVIDDLRNKVMFRSLALFNKEMNFQKEIKTYEDFQDYVNDDQLIEGAYKIGVVDWEASKVLRHCKETRHLFSGHPKSTDPTAIKVMALIDDCVKYVLSKDYPIQIIDINEYMINLASEEFDRNRVAIENALGDLPERYKIELVNRFFNAYIHANSSTVLRSNIEFCAPIIWKSIDRQTQIQVVRRLDQEIVKGHSPTIKLAFSFVEIVDGTAFLSLNAKKYQVEPILTRLESNLDVFSIENECVYELVRFSDNIPGEFIPRYVNALTQTYIGKTGGSAYFARTDFYADGASAIIPDLFQKFDDTSADAFIDCIKTNKILKSRIQREVKLDRLRSLAKIVLSRISAHYYQKDFLELLCDTSKTTEFYKRLK